MKGFMIELPMKICCPIDYLRTHFSRIKFVDFTSYRL